MEELTTIKLKIKYPYIVAYCKYMDSTPMWIHEQLWSAHNVNAPYNTIYVTIDNYAGTNSIKTFDMLSEAQQKGVGHYIKQRVNQ